MKKFLPITVLLLIALGVGTAEASLVVDPAAAALGSSSIFTPQEQEAEQPLIPTVRNMPSHWQGTSSSDIYLVRRGDGSDAWYERLALPSTGLRSLDAGDDPFSSLQSGAEPVYYDGPRIYDPTEDEWLGLDLRRGRDPVTLTPQGGGQPHTPTTPAPEPGTVMLLASGLGAVGAAGYARRRRAKLG